MSKLYTASIDVTKVKKELLYKGEKGTYLNLSIWINDEVDQYGNIMSLQQKTAKGEAKIYLGNGKEFEKKQPDPNQDDPIADDLPF